MLDDGLFDAGPARPSLRARLLSTYIRLAIKPHSKHGFDVAWARRVLEKPVVPTCGTNRILVEPVCIGALGGEAVQPRRPDDTGRTILYRAIRQRGKGFRMRSASRGGAELPRCR